VDAGTREKQIVPVAVVAALVPRLGILASAADSRTELQTEALWVSIHVGK